MQKSKFTAVRCVQLKVTKGGRTYGYINFLCENKNTVRTIKNTLENSIK